MEATITGSRVTDVTQRVSVRKTITAVQTMTTSPGLIYLVQMYYPNFLPLATLGEYEIQGSVVRSA